MNKIFHTLQAIPSLHARFLNRTEHVGGYVLGDSEMSPRLFSKKVSDSSGESYQEPIPMVLCLLSSPCCSYSRSQTMLLSCTAHISLPSAVGPSTQVPNLNALIFHHDFVGKNAIGKKLSNTFFRMFSSFLSRDVILRRSRNPDKILF